MATAPQQVLLIEDSPVCRDAMEFIFRTYFPKLQIITTSNGSEAIKIFSTHNNPNDIKLIILDLTLPDMSGIELYGYFQNNSASKLIPVIIQSGRSLMPEEIKELQKFQDKEKFIIPKTRSLEEFITTLEKILGKDKVIRKFTKKSPQIKITDSKFREKLEQGRGNSNKRSR